MATTTCNHKMRTGSCNMDAGHRGRHTTVAWRCDGCGKTQRGRVEVYSRDGEYASGLAFCFMCASPALYRGREW